MSWFKLIDSAWFAIGYPVILMLSIYTGVWYCKRFFLRKDKAWKNIGIENGILAIFGLLLSFSLLISGNSAKERVVMVHQSGDAMTMLYRKSKLCDDTVRNEIRNYLSQYITIILDHPAPVKKEKYILIAKLDSIDKRLDEHLISYGKEHPSEMHLVNDLIQQSEIMGSVSYRLLYSYGERTPSIVVFILVILSCLIGFFIGFLNSVHLNKNILIPFLFWIITSLMIYAIRDLDNPGKGFIKPSFENLKYVREWLNS
jgi:hypothetical protein